MRVQNGKLQSELGLTASPKDEQAQMPTIQAILQVWSR
jgi:hypothetical protein